MKKLIILLALLSLNAQAQKRVAIIDTGLDLKDPRFSKLLCKKGKHWNFVNNTSNPYDSHGHGTHIAGLIKQYAGNASYCLLIYKYYDDWSTGEQNLSNEIRALKQAVVDKADIINLSGGGSEFSNEERKAFLRIEELGILAVVAAGNDGKPVAELGYAYYPAAYGFSNIVVVGNLQSNFKGDCFIHPTSNRGSKVNKWEIGTYVSSTLPGDMMGSLTGTSQATAIRTGKILSGKRSEKCLTFKP